MAFWDSQAGAFKGKGSAGGGRHARPRRGRAACGVGRSGRIEGEVGRRGVLWQEKSWPRREVRSPPRSTAAFLAVAEACPPSRYSRSSMRSGSTEDLGRSREDLDPAGQIFLDLAACACFRRWAGRRVWAGWRGRRRLRARGGAAATCRWWTTSRWPLPPPLMAFCRLSPLFRARG